VQSTLEKKMTTTAVTTKEFVQEYFHALSGKQKDALLIDQYVSDPVLKKHILDTEAAFPGYELDVHRLVVEGDLAVANFTFRGVHKGAFAGIAPTGKAVTTGVMIFYRVTNGKIREFWMQLDLPALLAQLQGE
jgi:predicted ester cyclase